MKEFIRNFKKQKTIGVLNICSLSLGIMVSVIIGLWAINQLNFDNFHTNGERMYRVVTNFPVNGKLQKYAGAFKALGEEAITNEPDIEQLCRIVVQENEEIWIDNTIYFDNRVFITDNNFFTFFTFPLKEGDITTAFSARNNVIIDEVTALRYFPEKSAIGQVIRFQDTDFNISGIMYNMPVNSHLYANMIFPFFGDWDEHSWGTSDEYMTYFILNRDADIKHLDKKLTDIIYERMPIVREAGHYIELQALKDIHYARGFLNDSSLTTGNKSLTIVFILTAFFILLLSCINFTNLFISTSFIRAKAIGIKKSQGAGRYSLIRDFYKETAWYVFISIGFGLALAVFAVPFFSRYANFQLDVDFKSPVLYIFLLILFSLVVLIAGSFPALYMTRFGIIDTLISKFRGARISFFQKALVVVQFTTSILLLIVVFFFNRQVDYMIHQDLGFDKENVIYVNGRDKFGQDFDVFRDELMKDPAITDITMKNALPTEWRQGWPIKKTGSDRDRLMEICRVKPNYFDFFGMPIVAGENPFYQLASDNPNVFYCVINETAVKDFQFDDPIDQNIYTPLSNDITIIVKAVVRDSYTKSFHKKIDPQIYFKINWDQNNPIFFKIKGDPRDALKIIEEKWKSLIPDVPFEYHYLDDNYQQLYASEKSQGKILTGAMGISFLITVIGLFAMSYYSIQQRIKEIGIRKVNGATVSDLLLLLNKDFIIWVLISFLLACPVAYFFVKKQLDEFAVKTAISWWVFLLAGFITLVIALLTVSYQTWRAAVANPVDAIKNE